MRILMEATSSNEDYNADCDYIIASITQDYARHILELMDKVDELRSKNNLIRKLSELVLDDTTIIAYSANSEFSDMLGENSLYVEIPIGFQPPEDGIIPDAIYLSAYREFAEWECWPDDTGTMIWSTYLPRELIEHIASDDGDDRNDREPALVG